MKTILKYQNSRSAGKQQYTTPEKTQVLDHVDQWSRLHTQTSSNQKDYLSIQSLLIEQNTLKEDASRNEMCRLIREAIDTVERLRFQDRKAFTLAELNEQLSKLLIGLRTCIHQPELSNFLVQLIQQIREVNSDCFKKQQRQHELQTEELMARTKELEDRNTLLQHQFEQKVKMVVQEQKMNNYQQQLEELKKKNQKTLKTQPRQQTPQRVQLKDRIKEMQSKMQILSEKEKKLIQLVKAVQSRGYDVENIYQQIPELSSKQPSVIHEVPPILSTGSQFADNSIFSGSSVSVIRRNKQFLMD